MVSGVGSISGGLDWEDVQKQKDLIQQQMMKMRSSSDAAASAIAQSSSQVQETSADRAAQSISEFLQQQETPSALDRLQGQTDRYEEAEKDGSDQESLNSTRGRTRADTTNVDRELRTLRSTQSYLEREISQAEAREDQDMQTRLDKRLQSVQAELDEKDNDTYRKEHAVFTDLIS